MADDDQPGSWNHDEFHARYEDLSAQIASHSGMLAKQRWDEMNRARNIFLRNGGELDGMIYAIQNVPTIQMAVLRKPQISNAREEFFGKLDQRLANFVSSQAMLVDHTRRILKHYEGRPFYQEFLERNAVVRDLPSANFMRNLRNYLLHYGNAPLVTTYSFGSAAPKEGSNLKLSLDSAALLEWDSWSAKAREYIEASGEGVDLRQAFDEMSAATVSLYDWIFSQFDTLHSDDLAAVNALIDEANGMWGHPNPDSETPVNFDPGTK